MKLKNKLKIFLKGSCTIGGNIATHAGGKYFVKFGPLRAYILVKKY